MSHTEETSSRFEICVPSHDVLIDEQHGKDHKYAVMSIAERPPINGNPCTDDVCVSLKSCGTSDSEAYVNSCKQQTNPNIPNKFSS